MPDSPDYLELNRAWWDERAPLHAASDFYDLDGFVAGRETVMPFEPETIGDVTGLDLVHLQCHMGMDTLSWARRGARVTGLDFSTPAIETARALADRIGVDARFEVADVYDAVETLGATYDIAYQSLGSVNWHPDMARWAAVLHRLVRPGGRYCLLESHPFADVFDDGEGTTVAYDYFAYPEGEVFDDTGGSYADPAAETAHNRTIEFAHPISEVIMALVDAGFVVDHLAEYPFTVHERWPWLERRDDPPMTWWFPEGRVRLPLMYWLIVRRPG